MQTIIEETDSTNHIKVQLQNQLLHGLTIHQLELLLTAKNQLIGVQSKQSALPAHSNFKNPEQPLYIEKDRDGNEQVIFKKNHIILFLRETGKFRESELQLMGFSEEDYQQYYQLSGHSTSIGRKKKGRKEDLGILPKDKCIHPPQPLYIDNENKVRFKSNDIILFLLNSSKYTFTELLMMNFPQEDREQLYQLIGYTLCGYGELSNISDEAYERANTKPFQIIF